jgi:hypothetical protein
MKRSRAPVAATAIIIGLMVASIGHSQMSKVVTLVPVTPHYGSHSSAEEAAQPPGGNKGPSVRQIVTTETDGAKVVERRYAYVDEYVLWPFVPGQEKIIPVCWETAGYEAEKELVKSQIVQTWEASSGLRFRGWSVCHVGYDGIHIAIADAGPRTLGLGTDLNGVEHGMLLNFTFQKWGSSCAETRNDCIASIAVHEFGHAIGFAHEQNEPDAPGECGKLAQGKNGTLALTPYDPKSVMNYCNSEYNNNGKLSESDKVSAAIAYCSPAAPLCSPKIIPQV